MIISERNKTTGRFETCSLHDLMRDICLSKAKEENFLHIVGISSPTSHSDQSLNTPRRFVLHDPTTLDVERDINNSKVRSLVVIWKPVFKTLLFSKEAVPNFEVTRLQLLRALYLPQSEFKGKRLSNTIGKLIHLRYLNLEGALLSHLPSSLQNLTLLIYLNLRVLRCCHFPTHTYLLGMKKLRFLALPRHMRTKRKLELKHLVNLETLVNFTTKYCDLEDLRGMIRLRTLGINITDETSLETLSALIDGLRHLENLQIEYDLQIEYEGAKGTKEWNTLLDFNNLKTLNLMTRIPLLSDELQFPSRLTTLCLWGSGLKEDPMLILEKLVHLIDVTLGNESFSGRRIVCSRGGFPQLNFLELWGLEEWEEWIVEEGSMPLLSTLEITVCKKLKELPDGLRFITSLKDLSLKHMGEEWEKRLSEGGEDYYKVQHIPSVKIG